MLYKRLIINGVEFPLAVNQTGKGAPSQNTEGALGVLYMDTDTGQLYKCTAVDNGSYTWEKAENGSGGGDGMVLSGALLSPGYTVMDEMSLSVEIEEQEET